jgi:hypothetical protein
MIFNQATIFAGCFNVKLFSGNMTPQGEETVLGGEGTTPPAGRLQDTVTAFGKSPQTVKALSLLCFWAHRKLGMTTIESGKRLRPEVLARNLQCTAYLSLMVKPAIF